MSDVMIEGGNPKRRSVMASDSFPMRSSTNIFSGEAVLNRLLGVLAERPHLIGIGVDEGTAFVLEGDKWSVVGRSYVLACEVDKNGKSTAHHSPSVTGKKTMGCGRERSAASRSYHASGLPSLTSDGPVRTSGALRAPDADRGGQYWSELTPRPSCGSRASARRPSGTPA